MGRVGWYRQTAKLCSAHEGRSLVGLGTGEVPLGLDNRPVGITHVVRMSSVLSGCLPK